MHGRQPGLATTLNVVLNAASLGRYVWLEGLAELHGSCFTRFLGLVEAHDPHRKFANQFTRGLFADARRP